MEIAWIIRAERRVIEYKLQTYFSLTAERNIIAKYGDTVYLTECTKETI